MFYDLARIMSDRGHTVHIICNLSTEYITSSRNIVVHIVRPHLKEANQLPPSISQNLLFIITSVLQGINIVKKNKIDIIHTNSFTPIIAGSILGQVTGRPVICTVHDVFSGSVEGEWSKWSQTNKLPAYYSHLGEFLERISLRMPCNRIHAVSRATMTDILAIKRNAHVSLIYPGINVSPSHAYDSQDGEYCDFVLFIGRLVFYKNLEAVINSFRYVVRKIPKAKFLVIGDGPMKEIWMNMASAAGLGDNIIFLGNISASEKDYYLKKCSALVLPSTFEGFGLVILEAFAMAKPVLVSDVKPFDEIVDDSIDGFLLPKDDPLRWSEKIQYLLLNKEECRKMGARGLPKAQTKFSIARFSHQMEKLYLRFCSTAE